MANISGYDFSQYPGWQQVHTPSGGTYYVVPGTSYVYDPFLSQMKGRPVLFQNPTQADAAQKQQQDAQAAALQAQQNAASPLGQIAPVLGATAGSVGGALAIKALSPATAVGVTKGGGVLMSDGTMLGAGGTPAVAAPAQAAATVAPAASNAGAFTGAATAASTAVAPVQTLADGSVLMSDGSITTAEAAQAASSSASAAGAAGAAGSNTGSFLSGLTSDTGVAGLSDVGIGLGVAGGALGAYGLYQDVTSGPGGGKGALSGAESGAALGAAAGSFVPGVGTLVGAGVGAVVGGLAGYLGGHKTTRQVAADHTKDLASQGQGDAAWQHYIAAARAPYSAPPPDPSKPFFNGQFSTWDEYKSAGLNAQDLSGVYGNLRVYGPQWAHLTPAQQLAVTQANINSGVYDSKKGEVDITSDDQANQNLQNVLNGKVTPTVSVGSAAPAAPAAPAAAPVAPPRSATRSPGIGLDGKPINYETIGRQLAQRINQRNAH